MKIKSIVLSIVVLLSVFTVQVEMKTYEKDAFSIQYPETWELQITEKQGSKFILYSEMEENDSFRENINLLAQNVKGMNMTMDKFAKMSEDQIKTMVQGGEVLKSERVENGKYHQHLMIWKGTIRNINMMFKQYFYLKDDRTYILTYTALPETFEKFLKEGQPVLESFKLK